MPNNSRTHTDGSGVWANGYVTLPSDWHDLERKIFGSWNGDRGGSYSAPVGSGGDPYVFAGAGFKVTGPTRLSYGGAILGGSGKFVIKDGVWPELKIGHAGRTRSIVCPIQSYQLVEDSPRLPGYSSDAWKAPTWLWSNRMPYVGVGSVALASRLTTSRKVEVAPIYIELRVVDGATLTKVTLFFRVATKRKYAPIAMPKMRVLRVPLDSGNSSMTVLPEPLKDTTDGTGFDFAPLVTSPDTWYNDGEVQSFEYVCDQNNEIDCSAYHYVVHIVEEVGALSPDDEFDGIRFTERKTDCSGRVTNVTFAGASGSRILVTDPDDVIDNAFDPYYGGYLGSKNGIWDTAARAPDCDDIEDFTPNWIVRLQSGGTEANATWQCVHPSLSHRFTLSTSASGVSDPHYARPRIEPASPKGNIYHCLVPTFEVPDLRFQ